MIKKKSQRAEAELPLVDMTMKVVAVLAKRFMTQQDYENAMKSPASTFDPWLKKHDLSSKVRFQSRPNIKISGDQEWMERVHTIPERSLRHFLCVPGLDGIFTKASRTMDRPDETNTRFCWLSDLVCVNDAMKRIDPIKETTLGLEVGSGPWRTGLSGLLRKGCEGITS